MNTTTATALTQPPIAPDARAARMTGLLYLGLAVTGMLGFLIIRPQLFAPQDAAATLANLRSHEAMARAGIALEMALVVTQVLAALWFFKLFRPADSFAAGAIALFGTVNAVAVLVSAALLASALEVALHPIGDDAPQLMYVVSGHVWGVGNLFFGLWLIPMGSGVLRSAWPPRALGWLLMSGGVGYLLNGFSTYLLPKAPEWLDMVFVLPAGAGEFWMIGWLLLRGLRPRSTPAPAPAPPPAPAFRLVPTVCACASHFASRNTNGRCDANAPSFPSSSTERGLHAAPIRFLLHAVDPPRFEAPTGSLETLAVCAAAGRPLTPADVLSNGHGAGRALATRGDGVALAGPIVLASACSRRGRRCAPPSCRSQSLPRPSRPRQPQQTAMTKTPAVANGGCRGQSC